MEPHERAALLASTIELRIDSFLSHDDCSAPGFHGPELLVLAQLGKLVVLTPDGRTACELALEDMAHLLELAAAAEPEQHREGADTAIRRPITVYHLRFERMHRHHQYSGAATVNHYVPHALGPRWTALLTALRDLCILDSPAALAPWDFAATWLSPRDLSPFWPVDRVLPLPLGITAFEQEGPLYLRAGQPPARSELYRYDPGPRTGARTGGTLTQLIVSEPPEPSGRAGEPAAEPAPQRIDDPGLQRIIERIAAPSREPGADPSPDPGLRRGAERNDRRIVPATPLAEWHLTERWLLPCGAGSLLRATESRRPPRFVIHALDPARPLYVQRG